MTHYLDFEKPLADIEGKAEELRALARDNEEMDVEVDDEAGAMVEGIEDALDVGQPAEFTPEMIVLQPVKHSSQATSSRGVTCSCNG